MKKLLLFSLLATAMLFAACGDSNDEATPEDVPVGDAMYICEGSPIRYFYVPDNLDAYFLSQTQTCATLGFFLHTLDTDPIWGGVLQEHWGKGSEKFNEYVKYYGDTTYYGNHYIGNDYQVSAMPLNSIEITADKDFDSEHPAGSSLKDIFTFEYASAYNLIKSNYDCDLNIVIDSYKDGEIIDKNESMSLLEFKPINLIYYISYLYFNKLPEKLGTYEFTITFNYGKDPISGREAKVAPAVVKAEFTEKDYVALPKH